MTNKKAPARGKRKSIVDQYKAKARGKPDEKKSKPVKRKKKTVVEKKEQIMQMTINDLTYSVGDIAFYVDEYNASPSRPKTSSGEVVAVYPKDNIEPCVGLTDHETGKFRVVRARLVAWSKKDATANWKLFNNLD